MLVDDNEDDIELTLSALKEANVKNNVLVFEDGREAIAYLKGEGKYADRKVHPLPMLIMLDLKMPKVSGKEVLREIKGDDTLKTIPVVMLTSSAMESDIEE